MTPVQPRLGQRPAARQPFRAAVPGCRVERQGRSKAACAPPSVFGASWWGMSKHWAMKASAINRLRRVRRRLPSSTTSTSLGNLAGSPMARAATPLAHPWLPGVLAASCGQFTSGSASGSPRSARRSVVHSHRAVLRSTWQKGRLAGSRVCEQRSTRTLDPSAGVV